MKRFLLLSLLTTLSYLSYSQADFRKGYIITLTKDSLQGWVNYKEGVIAFETCLFKKSKNADIVSYTPSDIRGYGFYNNKYFESRGTTQATQGVSREFVEVLVDGAVSLYKGREFYFVDKHDSTLLPLTNEKIKVEVNGKKMIARSNQHVSTLNMLMSDCNKLKKKIQKTQLYQRNLTQLVEAYNSCVGSPYITYKGNKPWFKSTIGLASGINYSAITFDGGDNVEFEKSISPMVGLTFTLSSPRLSERFAFHGDFLHLNSAYYLYNTTQQPGYSQIDYVTIELQQLKIPISIQYTFPERKFTPFMRFGVSSTIHLSSSSNWTAEVVQDNILRTYSEEALTIKDRQFGYWGGLGLTKSIGKKLIAFSELRYEQTNGLLSTDGGLPYSTTSTIKNFQFILGLRLK